MTSLLRKTLEIGTLGGEGGKFLFSGEDGKKYRIAAAGKTGTTQNWADAWTVGFTPYYTAALWFGFDRPGNSLGLSLTGATLSGPIWGDFMREVHNGLPAKEFSRPATGVVDIRVCAKSGQLLTPQCNEGSVVLSFLDKYRPSGYCTYHERTAEGEMMATTLIQEEIIGLKKEEELYEYRMPTLNLDFLTPQAAAPVAPQAEPEEPQTVPQAWQTVPEAPPQTENIDIIENTLITGTSTVGTSSEAEFLEIIDSIEAPAYDPITE
jgi:penicillin-binding protein 1A